MKRKQANKKKKKRNKKRDECMQSKIIKFFWVAVLILFLILTLFIIVFFKRGKQTPVLKISKSVQKSKQINRPDNSNKVDLCLKQGPNIKLPIALVFDNLSEAWPISGINSGSIIYEAPVEADITRLLVIFNQDLLPSKIGPIRSARPYLADFAQEYGALFIHAGGSPTCLQRIKNKDYDIDNLDEISSDGIYFWREKKRDRPHNLYTSKQLTIQAIKNKKLVNIFKPDFIPWKYSQNQLINGHINNSIIKINYREPVVWQFDKKKQVYLRFQGGKPYIDEKDKQSQTPNLIIQKTEIKILDSLGHRFIKTSGQGDALIFRKGFLIKGKWRKSTKDARTKFYDAHGQEIKFLPGPIWIEIVSANHKVLYN